MDRVTLIALLVAGMSVMASLVVGHSAERVVYHGLALLLPLACIAFPETIEAAFRHGRSGRVHGGEGPTPGIFVRIVAWGLLIVMVVIHFTIDISRFRA